MSRAADDQTRGERHPADGDDPVARYLSRIVARCRRSLDADLRGLYVIGSLALGGYIAGRSDVDVIALTRGASDRSRMRALVDLLAHPGLPCPARRLELVVYPAPAVSGGDPSLDWTLNLNTGRDVGVAASFEPRDEPRHWFVLDVAMARTHARRLLGPPPAAVFAPLGRARVLEAILDSLSWHEQNDGAGADTVLNACRGLRFAREGLWSPKQEAAAWARARAPDPALVDAAAASRLEDAPRALDRERVRRFVSAVRSAIQSETSWPP